MTIDEAVTYLREALDNVDPAVHTEFRMSPQEVEQLLEWLEEYHKIKEYWLPSDEEELRKERGECNNLYDKIDIVVNGLYSKIADQILEKIGLESKYKHLEADYIELDNRLRTANTEIDRLQSESSWHSCDEKPPERITYLVSDGYCVYFGFYDVFKHKWVTNEDTDGNSLLYWMEIPKPPKEVTS